MIEDTIAELEARLKKAETVNSESRAELLRLFSTLRSEIATLAATHQEDAESIAGFTTVSTHEALREKRDPELMKISREGLSSSVTKLEDTHPGLVQLVNRICQTLANLGI